MKRTLTLVVWMAGSIGSAACGGAPLSSATSTPAPISEPSTSAAAPEQSSAPPEEQGTAVPEEQSAAVPEEQSAATDTPDSAESGPEPPPALPPPPAAVASPNGNVTFGNVRVSGAAVSDAARVVAGMRSGFRSCYKRSLNDDPEASGDLRLTLTIGADGGVHHVSAVPSGRLSSALMQCVRARSQRASFAIAAGGTARVSVPVSFATK